MKAFPGIGTGVTLGARTTALFPESERLSPKTYRLEYSATASEATADQIIAQSQQMTALFTSLPLS
jgi:hypothetical protein